MTSRRNTCDRCAHYRPDENGDVKFGECAMTLDSNDEFGLDRAHGWDYEGYQAGVYVGPKFGCIHFSKKEAP